MSSKPPATAATHVGGETTAGGHGFAGDVLRLVSGTTFAQLLTILAAPLVARLYAPTAFGVASIFTSIASTIAVIACLRYETAIMLPSGDDDAANLLAASVGLALFITVLTVPCVWLGRQPARTWLVRNGLLDLAWLIPVAVLLDGTLLAFTFWNTRRRRFGLLSVVRIAGTSSSTGTQLLAGTLRHGNAVGLVLAGMVGSAVQTTSLGVNVLRNDWRLIRRSVTPARIRRLLREHRKFPLYSSWAILLYEVADQIPTFWLAATFSSQIVGYYAVGTRLLRVPMNVVGSSIGQVFFERAAKAKPAGILPQVVEVTFRSLVTIGLFPLLIITLCGKDIFVVILGNRWAEAGIYAGILAPWMFFWFLSSPLMQLINVLGKQEWGLAFNIVLLISRAAALAGGAAFHNPRLAMILLSVAGVVSYGYLNHRLMAEAGFGWSKSLGLLLRRSLGFVPAGLALILARRYGASSTAMVGLAGGCGAVYAGYVFKYAPEARRLIDGVRRGGRKE